MGSMRHNHLFCLSLIDRGETEGPILVCRCGMTIFPEECPEVFDVIEAKEKVMS